MPKLSRYPGALSPYARNYWVQVIRTWQAICEISRTYSYAEASTPEAEQLYKRALANQERVLGSKHADIADTLTSLGFLKQEQGEYAEAAALLADP